MFTSLQPGAIGVETSGISETLELAARHGFAGVHFSIQQAAQLGANRLKDMAAAHGVRLSAFGFPVNFRGDLSEFGVGLEALPAQVEVAAALDVRRTATWIVPASDDLTYEENFQLHATRLRPCADILADYDIRLGLEYVAPKTKRLGVKHEFVHTMDQMADLCQAVGPNCGFLIDAWHWYTAHEDVTHLQRLSADQVVDVHANDAPEGRAVDEQIDSERCLPGETGLIDIVTFLTCLKRIGYDGPVMVEPFSDRVRQMSADDACAATVASLRQVFTDAGI
ncbi:MAG: sugar phosphate isomerase/epimerase family protein [Candidatus Latescibacterota bacterium]|nr:sugar phosphate isomerase/epimerase family protein [Candidatus Latescibacterota bacterium]